MIFSTGWFVGILVAFSPGWPRGVIDSESLNKVLTSLDGGFYNLNVNEKILTGLAAKRCETWDETDRLQLALIWASYSFRCAFLKQCHPPLPLLFFVIIVGIDIHTAS